MRFAGVINVNSDYSMSSGAGMSSDTGMRSNVGMNSDISMKNIASVLEGVPGEKLYKEMHAMELSHLKQENRRSREFWSALLAEDFIEYQSSGGIINKQQVLDALETESDITFEMSDFKSKPLSATVVLNTYQLIKVSGKGEKMNRTLRSSIWKYEDERWQLVFHQGTMATI